MVAISEMRSLVSGLHGTHSVPKQNIVLIRLLGMQAFLHSKKAMICGRGSNSLDGDYAATGTSPRHGVGIEKEVVLLMQDNLLKLAERQGFEPRVRRRTPVFKTGAFDHSAISPLCLVSLS